MLNRLIDYAALLLISSGGIAMLIGIAGGTTGLLSEGTPLFLTAIGVAALYLALVLTGARLLWLMDKPRSNVAAKPTNTRLPE